MLNDHPIVLNDRVLEHLLAGLHQLGGRLRSHRPTREPLSKHVGKSARSPLAFDAALCVAAMYRRLIAQHPRVLLRELDGAGTFEAADLSNRFQDELDWADLATIGAARRPVQRPGSSFDQRNFRIRQFVGFMRSEHGFTLTRSQTVGAGRRDRAGVPWAISVVGERNRERTEPGWPRRGAAAGACTVTCASSAGAMNRCRHARPRRPDTRVGTCFEQNHLTTETDRRFPTADLELADGLVQVPAVVGRLASQVSVGAWRWSDRHLAQRKALANPQGNVRQNAGGVRGC